MEAFLQWSSTKADAAEAVEQAKSRTIGKQEADATGPQRDERIQRGSALGASGNVGQKVREFKSERGQRADGEVACM